jgi:hypothetical protein
MKVHVYGVGAALVGAVLMMGASIRAQQIPVFLGDTSDAYPQPTTWTAVEAAVKVNGAPAGRFWRSSDGSTRLERLTPDAAGVTIEIRNIPQAKYYVYRPQGGWTRHPMVLPTGGWHPVPVSRRALGSKLADLPFEVYEHRKSLTVIEGRVPQLNFLTVSEVLPDGTSRTLTDLQLREPAATLFQPPATATVASSNIAAGIVALPSSRGRGNR